MLNFSRRNHRQHEPVHWPLSLHGGGFLVIKVCGHALNAVRQSWGFSVRQDDDIRRA